MKLHEIVNLPSSPEQLDELDLRKAISTGALTLSTLMAPSPVDAPIPAPVSASAQEQLPVSASAQEQLDVAILANTILKKYKNVSPKLAQRVASLAKKYEKDSFPKATDILAIIGIESSFNPHSVSKLSTDPAVGLMQVRPKVWDMSPAKLKNNIDLQIQTGAEILHKYFNRYGSVNDAVHVYNVGPGNFNKGNHNIDYVHKFKAERNLYKKT